LTHARSTSAGRDGYRIGASGPPGDTAEPRAWLRLVVRRTLAAAPRPAGVLQPAAAALFVLASLPMLDRVLGWRSGIGPDSWAYAAWGRMLVEGRFHLVAVPTYPNPLGYLLGIAVSPFAPARVIPALVAVAMAASVAWLFQAGARTGGALGGVLAACVFASTYGFAQSLQWATIDACVAAVVLAALASGGRARVGLLMLAGLARPEAWPVAGLACYLALAPRRPIPVRLGLALAAGAAAPAAWGLVDWWIWGVPFAFLPMVHGHVPGAAAQSGVLSLLLPGGGREATLAAAGADPHLGFLSFTGAIAALWHSLVREAGGWQLAAGAAGLALLCARAAARRRVDFLPLAAVLWATMSVVELQVGLQPFARYTFPLVAMLAAGAAPLASLAARVSGTRATMVGAAVCAAAAVAATYETPPDPPPNMVQAALIVRSLPALHTALSCGRVGVVAVRRPESPTTAMLAVLAGVPLSQVPTVHTAQAGGHLAAILVTRGTRVPMPPGTAVRTPLGTILLLPSCVRRLGAAGTPLP
jgi:hypothetical protein